MKLDDFLATHPFFTISDVERYVAEQGQNPKAVRSWMLSYYRNRGRIATIRRGLYATLSPDPRPDGLPADPFLIASHQKPDAVVAYQTALQFYDAACWTTRTFYTCSRAVLSPLKLAGYVFRVFLPPSALHRKNQDHLEVETVPYAGWKVRVTTIERTICDVVTRPGLSGGWENVLCAFNNIRSVNVPHILKYLEALENRTTAAKIGYILTKFRERWNVKDEHIEALRALCPKQPHYIERSKRRNGRMFGKFNILVPDWMVSWQPDP